MSVEIIEFKPVLMTDEEILFFHNQKSSSMLDISKFNNADEHTNNLFQFDRRRFIAISVLVGAGIFLPQFAKKSEAALLLYIVGTLALGVLAGLIANALTAKIAQANEPNSFPDNNTYRYSKPKLYTTDEAPITWFKNEGRIVRTPLDLLYL